MSGAVHRLLLSLRQSAHRGSESGADVQSLADAIRRRSFRRVKALRRQFTLHAPRSKTVVFVAGVHRSGTNMLMEMLERSWQTDVFDETDPVMFDDYIMRNEATVRRLVKRSTAPVVVIKALHETHLLSRLLDIHRPAKAIWIIRAFDDVVNSTVRHWPGWKNKIDELVQDRTLADWRGMGMTDDTYRIVKNHYRPDMTDISASALFWYYRNQLLFDQELQRDDRVILLKYEDLVQRPRDHVRRLADFMGIKTTNSMLAVPRHNPTLRENRVVIPSDLRELCHEMQLRLCGACSQRR